MEIKDKEGQVRIKFSNFKKQYGDDVTDNSGEQPSLIKLSYSWG
jgi:hypothetical protein